MSFQSPTGRQLIELGERSLDVELCVMRSGAEHLSTKRVSSCVGGQGKRPRAVQAKQTQHHGNESSMRSLRCHTSTQK
jgi:hypothetical protein